jgi:large subunit ribosomal protein L20
MNGLRKANVKVDRKMLAEMAVNDYASFSQLVAVAKEKLRSEGLPTT